MTVPDEAVRAAVDAAYRDEWGQVVATLIGLIRDWDLAEDCAQDAFATALATWRSTSPGFLARLMPTEPEPRGLLALMLLHEARRATRTDDGALVTLEHQDRSRWDRALIAEGVAVLDQVLAMRRSGSYQVQAAIAACHVTAPDAASTDWPQIAALYAELERRAPSPVVQLNRAVAIAMSGGIPAGLALVDELAESGRLDGYHLLPATRFGPAASATAKNSSPAMSIPRGLLRR